MRKFKKQMGVLLAAALVAGSAVPVSAEDVPANLEGEQTTAETQEEQRPEETTGETEETEAADREETASPEESAGEAEGTETTDGEETSSPEESNGKAEGSETSQPEESAGTTDTEEKPEGQQRPGEITEENSGTEAADSKKDSQLEKSSRSTENIKYQVSGGYIYLNPDSGEIVGCDKSVTAADIPSKIEGITVTSIGDFAFLDCGYLENINISDSVTSIGNSTFTGCSSLKNIVIPDSVISIGVAAFSNCHSLKSVAIPDSITSIGSSTFAGCNSLESIVLPNSATLIGNGAFSGCSSLKDITIPNDMIIIEDYAFDNCSSLKSISIPKTVTFIGVRAFVGCDSLNDIHFSGTKEQWNRIDIENKAIPDHITIHCSDGETGKIKYQVSGGYLYLNPGYGKIMGCDKSVTAADIPSEVEGKKITSIEDHAFSDCFSLQSVTIPDSVTSIENYAFSGCRSLKSVTIPDGVTSIKSSTFSGCRSLESVAIPDSVTSIESSAFSGCSSLESVTIPNSVTSIEDHAFYGCSSLESVTIPNSVTSIEGSAFFGCRSLKSVTIPDSVTSIENYAFYGCSSLKSVALPNNAASIKDYAFYDCSSLKDITIPNGVISIGDSAFSRCGSLERVSIPQSVTFIGKEAFDNCGSLRDIHFAETKEQWNSINHSTLPICTAVHCSDGDIGNIKYQVSGGYIYLDPTSGEIVYCDKSVTEANIPSKIADIQVTSIGENAFDNCSSLKSISIPNTVTSIGDKAFRWCYALEDVYFLGTEEQWNQISIGGDNNSLQSATIHFGSEVPESYTIQATQPTGGSVTLSTSSAQKGDTVTISVACDNGYKVKSVTATDESGKAVALTDKGNGKYSFTMPEANVTVQAVLERESEPSKSYAIQATQPTGGSVTLSASSAQKGDTVTVSVACDRGYRIKSVTATDESGKAVALTDKGNGEYSFTMPEANVTVQAVLERESEPSKSYAIQVTQPTGGSVTLSASSAQKGDTVTVSVACESGYKIKSVTATDESGKAVALTDKGNGEYSFTMPEANVTVQAVLERESESSKSYAIQVTQPTGGSVALSASSAQKGDTVTISVAHDRGYRIKSVTVTDENGKKITLRSIGGGKYRFTMPESDVTIQAILQKESSSGSSSSSDTSNSYESVDTYEDSSDDADSSSSSSRSSGATILIHGAGSSTVTAVTADSVTKAIRQSAGTGTTASVSITDTAKITKEVLGKMTAPVTFKGTGYQVTIDPAKMTEKLDIQLGVKPSAPTAQKTFEKFFREPVATISCAQQGEYGGNIYVDIKPDKLSNLDLSKTVYVYSWNPVTNTYKRVGTAVRLSNGWIRCYTTRGYDLILSNSDTFTRR